MPENNILQNGGEIKRDENMDLLSLLNEKPEEDDGIGDDTTIELSPLDKAKQEKAKRQSGIIVDNKDLYKKDEPLRPLSDSDERRDDVSKYANELDNLTDIANKVVAPKPKNEIESAQLMTALSEISETGSIQTHNPIADQIRLKTDDDVQRKQENSQKGEQSNATNASSSENVNGTDDRTLDETVKILIDKTGLGGNIIFTDEEKKKIKNSSVINITEVSEEKLKTIKYIKPASTNAFTDQIEAYQLSCASTPICFPASRFRAQMGGLSYGELGDISLDPDSITFDQVKKRLSVVYNKMHNTNVDNFKSFDDFLKKFAYIDLNMAIYGLAVSTFPEEDSIELTCGNKDCPKATMDSEGNLIKATFSHKYSPRSLIEFDRCGKNFLKYTEEIADCRPSEYNHLFESSSVQSYKAIELPDSGFVVEVGIASAYDYLYQVLDVVVTDEERAKELFGDDVNGVMQLNLALLSIVRSVSIPGKNGEFTKFTGGVDIVKALYNIRPREIKLLLSILGDTTDSYATSFAFHDVKCPHCGKVTKRVPVDIDKLVFTEYQQLMTSEINIENTLTL